jgi:hypothetical protein
MFKFSTYIFYYTDLGMVRVKKQLNTCSINHSQQSQHHTSITTVATEIVNIQETMKIFCDMLLWIMKQQYQHIAGTSTIRTVTQGTNQYKFWSPGSTQQNNSKSSK